MGRSTKPYLIRALHEWCTESHYTPYLVVWVNEHAIVPIEYAKGNEIVLNISYNATSDLAISNEVISFSARFGGIAREVAVPMGNVMSIFAHETGEGMSFDVELTAPKLSARPIAVTPSDVTEHADSEPAVPDSTRAHRPPGRPSLHIVK